jgi:hypothetical protein
MEGERFNYQDLIIIFEDRVSNGIAGLGFEIEILRAFLEANDLSIFRFLNRLREANLELYEEVQKYL